IVMNGTKSAIQTESDQRSIHISNLYETIDEAQLRQYFINCGNIKRCTVIRNLQTRESLGVAFIEFENIDSARMAMNMHGEHLLNRPIQISMKKTKCQTNRLKPNKYQNGHSSNNYNNGDHFRLKPLLNDHRPILNLTKDDYCLSDNRPNSLNFNNNNNNINGFSAQFHDEQDQHQTSISYNHNCHPSSAKTIDKYESNNRSAFDNNRRVPLLPTPGGSWQHVPSNDEQKPYDRNHRRYSPYDRYQRDSKKTNRSRFYE
ncbi:unnamed protein product, partial [Didymodactylos carnosus]